MQYSILYTLSSASRPHNPIREVLGYHISLSALSVFIRLILTWWPFPFFIVYWYAAITPVVLSISLKESSVSDPPSHHTFLWRIELRKTFPDALQSSSYTDFGVSWFHSKASGVLSSFLCLIEKIHHMLSLFLYLSTYDYFFFLFIMRSC